MKTKQKLTLGIILSIMSIAIIGLTIAVILVSSNVNISNSMIVKYEVTGASVDVTTTAKNYSNSGYVDFEQLTLSDDFESNKTSITNSFTFGEKVTGNISFNTANLTASGRSVYYFHIKNTAPTTSTNILKASVNILDLANNDTDGDPSNHNVKILMGCNESEADAKEYNFDNTNPEFFAEIGTGGEEKYIVVIIMVDDPSNAVDYTCNMNLIIGYDITIPQSNGTQSSPLLIGQNTTEPTIVTQQFLSEIASNSTLQSTRYYDENGNAVASADEASKMVESYPTIDIIYDGSATQNSINSKSNTINTPPENVTSYVVTNKRYINLTQDVDISNTSDVTSDNVASIELDGGIYDTNGILIGKHKLTIDGSKLSANNSRYLFSELYDSTIKNLTIELINEIGGIVYMAKGTVVFDNVDVISKDGSFVQSTTNNRSALCGYVYPVGYNYNAEFIDCDYNAKLMVTANYSGLYIGGYAYTNGYVSFENCTYGGEIYVTNSIGVLFGNPYHAPRGGYRVNNFTSIGKIYYAPKTRSNGTVYNIPHILASELSSLSSSNDKFNTDEYTSLDTTFTGTKITASGTATNVTINDDFATPLSSDFTASADNKDLIISSSKNLNTDLTYNLQLSTNFCHVNYNTGHKSTTLLTITIPLNISEITTTKTYENILLPLIDKVTYINNGGEIPTSATWTEINATGYKYYKTNSCYVIDFGTNPAFYLHESALRIPKWTIVAMNNNKIICGFAQGGNIPYVSHIKYKASYAQSKDVTFSISGTIINGNTGYALSNYPGIDVGKEINFENLPAGEHHLYFYNNNNDIELSNDVVYEITITIYNNSGEQIRVRAGGFDNTLQHVDNGKSATITATFTSPKDFSVALEIDWINKDKYK